MCNLFGSHSSNSGTSSSNTNSTTTPVIPSDWTDFYNKIKGNLSDTGATPDQTAAQSWLTANMGNPALATALTGANASGTAALGAANTAGTTALTNANNAAGNGLAMANNSSSNATGGVNAAAGNVQTGSNYLTGQLGQGSNTLSQWFPGQVQATNAPAVNGGTGAAFMGAYQTPLSTDYVNNSLASFDQGAANDYNTLRGQNADAFGNKRTGVAEGQFQATNALNRGTLASQLNLNAFNTAAGLGQTDASRALTADTTNAGNLLNNSQFNTSLTNNRQQFDVNQADVGQAARTAAANDLVNAGATGANVATAGSNIGSQDLTNNLNYGNSGVTNATNVGNSGVTNATNVGNSGVSNSVNVNNAGVNNANAAGNMSNMTLQQLMSLLGLGTSTFGQNTVGNSNGATSGSSTTFGGSASFKLPGT